MLWWNRDYGGKCVNRADHYLYHSRDDGGDGVLNGRGTRLRFLWGITRKYIWSKVWIRTWFMRNIRLLNKNKIIGTYWKTPFEKLFWSSIMTLLLAREINWCTTTVRLTHTHTVWNYKQWIQIGFINTRYIPYVVIPICRNVFARGKNQVRTFLNLAPYQT